MQGNSWRGVGCRQSTCWRARARRTSPPGSGSSTSARRPAQAWLPSGVSARPSQGGLLNPAVLAPVVLVRKANQLRLLEDAAVLRASLTMGGDRGAFDGLMALVTTCLYQGRRPGCAPGGAVPFTCVAKRKSPKRRRPRCPCPPSPYRALGAACDARAWGDAEELPALPLRGSSGQTASASQTTMRVSFGTRSPQALRFSARSEGGGTGLHTGHCFARPGGPSLRSARQSDRPDRRQRAARTDPRRSCAAAAVFVPAPHPFWLRREAQELGWVRVPKDTRTSWSSLPMLFERSSKNAASSSAPPELRASQAAPVRPTGRTGDADWGPPSLW